MPLSDLQVFHVCKMNVSNNQTCRYLSEDIIFQGSYQCLKLTGQKPHIDEAVSDYISSRVSEDDVPVGDNCPGYPVLRHAVVGFDKDQKRVDTEIFISIFG